ncbi:26S proteasome non-ATPase regulatory subunit 10-like [Contarinia nasturtii]|uniref:26S proteasome non-ATPase regulatory subunit 10-like n=1 Tax=Contarinia nasturtii TaxID=265458 RepID=UPI0012D46D9E|nr:26S proteasome non-ATPase regulatory subunit 10-like [Contarinia nasturtii]
MASKGDLLMEIASMDFIESESKILENVGLVTQKDANHRLLLHWGALMGKERFVEFLLNFKECPIDPIDDTGATPLILATLKGSLPIVKLLIERGANVNHQNNNGHTPVKYAGSKNHKDILLHLLDCGADPNARDHIGDTPLHRIASMEHHDCLRMILTHPKSSSILLLDAQNKLGMTPLHLACEVDDPVGAIMLIDKGASTEISNKDELTPLQVCKPYIRRKLLDHIESKAK